MDKIYRTLENLSVGLILQTLLVKDQALLLILTGFSPLVLSSQSLAFKQGLLLLLKLNLKFLRRRGGHYANSGFLVPGSLLTMYLKKSSLGYQFQCIQLHNKCTMNTFETIYKY